MKKWTILLVLCLMLCLPACRAANVGSSEPQQTDDHTIASTQAATESLQTEPTVSEEERLAMLMYDYNEIVGKLDLYTYGGAIYISTGDRSNSFSGNEAMRYAYEKLTQLEEIDAWLNEESWAKYVYPGYYPNFDRQSYLDRFWVLEDVLLRVERTRYHNGGESYTTQEEWAVYNYNPDGSVCYIKNGVWHLEEFYTYSHITQADLFYCYGENGQWIKAYFGDPDDYRLTLTQSFDEDGRLSAEYFAKDTVTHRIEYTYDDAGALIQKVLYENVDWDPDLSLRYVTDYVYDETGRLIREEERYMNFDSQGDPAYLNYSRTLEYEYGSDGRRSTAVQTDRVYTLIDSDRGEVELFSTLVSNYSYEYDEAGRLLTRTAVYMPAQYTDGTDAMLDPETIVEQYVYGDCYVYGQLVVEP